MWPTKHLQMKEALCTDSQQFIFNFSLKVEKEESVKGKQKGVIEDKNETMIERQHKKFNNCKENKMRMKGSVYWTTIKKMMNMQIWKISRPSRHKKIEILKKFI